MKPAQPDSRPSVAFRLTHGVYTRYKRRRAAKPYFCILCRRHGAVREGDETLVRASDNTGRICLACEPKAKLLVSLEAS